MIDSDRWKSKAVENVDKWGLQDKETVAMAMMEELGELTQAILQYNELDHDVPDADEHRFKYQRMLDELDDLAALMYQMKWALVIGTRIPGA